MSDQDKPFNDGMDHKQTIEGHPKSGGGSLPFPAKVFLLSSFGASFLLIINALFFN
ncbi:hypothetical protein LCM20_09745 [Halobacillus litoralis]|uniref:hypothetical protein n=1 Tax=Halobacillus litoralis TaxID=45668 RepID=UPI001CD42B5A|nr:hypothetical protein [Halobacillus litoralis]MCA0970872.1 hypothetical protein [Halobacillus litoralis]